MQRYALLILTTIRNRGDAYSLLPYLIIFWARTRQTMRTSVRSFSAANIPNNYHMECFCIYKISNSPKITPSKPTNLPILHLSNLVPHPPLWASSQCHNSHGIILLFELSSPSDLSSYLCHPPRCASLPAVPPPRCAPSPLCPLSTVHPILAFIISQTSVKQSLFSSDVTLPIEHRSKTVQRCNINVNPLLHLVVTAFIFLNPS